MSSYIILNNITIIRRNRSTVIIGKVVKSSDCLILLLVILEKESYPDITYYYVSRLLLVRWRCLDWERVGILASCPFLCALDIILSSFPLISSCPFRVGSYIYTTDYILAPTLEGNVEREGLRERSASIGPNITR